ncbi:MAG TPA: ADP-ribosylation factor-like protein [Candidatus Krumholzibacteriaceae bacterium]|nr:ADP-ribosylation factor-like protein [Candidatus Krumholzibacteriaceae bacterium]
MAVYNRKDEEVTVKIVYYGPGLSGKTTNLEHIYSKLPGENKGKMVSMKTRTDRTLFFDFLPMKIEHLNNISVKCLIYTVPGQVFYNATRKLVLKGVDAIVFVADSSPGKMDDNMESLANLEENLRQTGKNLDEIPWVLQYNKQDIGGALNKEIMDEKLNKSHKNSFGAIATKGTGVYETFESIVGLVMRSIEKDIPGNRSSSSSETHDTENKEEKTDVEAEVVPNTKLDDISSEADESESLNNSAEEKKEEHESVSEFVDNVLSENEESVEFEPSAGEYGNYGRVVDFPDDSNNKPEERSEEAGNSVATEFINDPLERLAQLGQESTGEEKDGEETPDLHETENTVRIPVKLSKVDIENLSKMQIIVDLSIE